MAQCPNCNGPDYLCTCKRDGLVSSSSGGSSNNAGYNNSSYDRNSSYGNGYGGNSGNGRSTPTGNSYSNSSSRATNYSDTFDRDRSQTSSSASSYNVDRCGRCQRARHQCTCLRNQPYVPNRTSTSRPNRSSPAYTSSNSGSSSGMCYRCRRSKSSCTCISGTLYNPGGYSNERTAYRNEPAFDDPPSYSDRDWYDRPSGYRR
ncbi:uncharacterized protein LY89DRAFT_395578 [Mollisia scopiformis]|uniref:Uncharacterized protein n=1 Tax=Mollisia scopiformis TaxID=149040 RepID=A0A194XQ53_MOLSC|nr:uncharacterized protein LY89DRAFT_395578 [Mollisia scopiformis]KUJ22184.1 hypothetical protein LY89DRAFT_395578 [Mollisia scopiformis]